GAGCSGAVGQSCNATADKGAWSQVWVYWADLLLANSSTPTGSAFSGTLLAPQVHGTADLAFTAAAPGGPGVYRVVVDVDGTPLYSATPNTNQGTCVAHGTDPASGALIFDY